MNCVKFISLSDVDDMTERRNNYDVDTSKINLDLPIFIDLVLERHG